MNKVTEKDTRFVCPARLSLLALFCVMWDNLSNLFEAEIVHKNNTDKAGYGGLSL
jgi:hypothetical protein